MVSSGTAVPSLRVGQTCDITIEAGEGGGQYKSRVEDVDGAKLSVAMPTLRGELVTPPVGRTIQITVQGSGGGNVFIQAEVTGRQSQPFPILTTRIVSVSQQQARSYFRADVTVWPSECSVWGEWPAGPAGGAPTDGAAPVEPGHNGAHLSGPDYSFWRPIRATVHDLSGGGAALLAYERLSPGERVKLRFPLPYGGGEIAVSGQVRRSIDRGRDSDGDTRWDLGVAFEGMKPDVQDRLVKAVTRVQAEERRRQQQG